MADDMIDIHQQWAQGVDVKIELLKGRELHVEKEDKRHKIKYIVDLLALDDTSQQKTILGWKWFVAGLAAVLLMVLCLKFLPMLDESMLYMILTYAVGLAVSAGCFYMAYKGTSRKQIFFSRSVNVPLVELAINNPSKKEFSAFVSKVEESILSSREGLKLSMKNQLAGEMKMLRRLSEKGVVSASIYQAAKSELLHKHE